MRSPAVAVELYSADGTYVAVTPHPIATHCGMQPPPATRHCTAQVMDLDQRPLPNGLGPRFDAVVHCLAENAATALLRVVVVADPAVASGHAAGELAYESLPLGLLRPGYRCLRLRDTHTGTRIRLCSLLVHVSVHAETPTPRLTDRTCDHARLMSVWLSAHVATRAAATLQRSFLRRRRRLHLAGLLGFERSLRDSAALARRAWLKIRVAWVSIGTLLFCAGVASVATGRFWGPGAAFLSTAVYCGAMLAFMAVQPTDERVVPIAEHVFQAIFVVSALALTADIARHDGACTGLGEDPDWGDTTGHPSCAFMFYYVLLVLTAVGELLFYAQHVLRHHGLHAGRTARARLSLIWGTGRCVVGCNATAFLVRATLPLFANGGTWPPTRAGGTAAFVLDVVEVLFLWLVVGVLTTPANRQRAQRRLRRLTDYHGEGSSAVVSYVACMAGGDATRHLSLARRTGRILAVDTFFVGAADLTPGNAATNVRARVEPVAFGQVDAFVSHSWRDSPERKAAALHAWAARERARSGVAPRVWIDCACGIEPEPEAERSAGGGGGGANGDLGGGEASSGGGGGGGADDGLVEPSVSIVSSSVAAAPAPAAHQRAAQHELAMLPVALAGCRTLLVLAGESYLSRLWCLLEVFTWLQLGKPASRIVVVPLYKTAPPAAASSAVAAMVQDDFLAEETSRTRVRRKQRLAQLVGAMSPGMSARRGGDERPPPTPSSRRSHAGDDGAPPPSPRQSPRRGKSSKSKTFGLMSSGTSWLVAQAATLEPEDAECEDPEVREAMLASVEASFGDLSVVMPAVREVFTEGNHEQELVF